MGGRRRPGGCQAGSSGGRCPTHDTLRSVPGAALPDVEESHACVLDETPLHMHRIMADSMEDLQQCHDSTRLKLNYGGISD